MGVRATVHSLPACDIHPDRKARYDFRVAGTSTWMYGCRECYALHGGGLGTGKGQYLVVKPREDEPLADN